MSLIVEEGQKMEYVLNTEEVSILTEMAFLWRVLRTEMRRFRILTEFR